MADASTEATQAAQDQIQAAIAGGRFLFGEADYPAKGGSWSWLQGFAQGAQWVVREQQPRRMHVLITWEYDAEQAATE